MTCFFLDLTWPTSRSRGTIHPITAIKCCTSIQNLASDAFNGLEYVGLLKLAYLDLTELASFTFRGLNVVRQLTIENSDLGRTINS